MECGKMREGRVSPVFYNIFTNYIRKRVPPANLTSNNNKKIQQNK